MTFIILLFYDKWCRLEISIVEKTHIYIVAYFFIVSAMGDRTV